MNNMPIGVDTLHLGLTDVMLTEEFSANVELYSYNSRTGEIAGEYLLCVLPNGKELRGKKAFVNHPPYRLQITPYSVGRGAARVRIELRVAVPRILGADNYHPTSGAQFSKALEEAEHRFAELGCRFNIRNAQVRRLDAARVFETANPCSSYLRFLTFLIPRRMNLHIYPTSLLWENEQRELAFYDKYAEMQSAQKKRKRRSKVGESNLLSYPRNSMRAEIRWLNPVAFKAATKLSTAGEVMDNFGVVQETFRRQFHRSFFSREPRKLPEVISTSHSVEQLIKEFESVEETFMKTHRQSKSVKWLELWLERDWGRLQTPEGLATIKTAISEFAERRGSASQNVHKKWDKLDNLVLSHGLHVQDECSVASLYSELREKVLAD